MRFYVRLHPSTAGATAPSEAAGRGPILAYGTGALHISLSRANASVAAGRLTPSATLYAYRSCGTLFGDPNATLSLAIAPIALAPLFAEAAGCSSAAGTQKMLLLPQRSSEKGSRCVAPRAPPLQLHQGRPCWTTIQGTAADLTGGIRLAQGRRSSPAVPMVVRRPPSAASLAAAAGWVLHRRCPSPVGVAMGWPGRVLPRPDRHGDAPAYEKTNVHEDEEPQVTESSAGVNQKGSMIECRSIMSSTQCPCRACNGTITLTFT